MDREIVEFDLLIAELQKRGKKLTIWMNGGEKFGPISATHLSSEEDKGVWVWDDGSTTLIYIDIGSVAAIGYTKE